MLVTGVHCHVVLFHEIFFLGNCWKNAVGPDLDIELCCCSSKCLVQSTGTPRQPNLGHFIFFIEYVFIEI